MVQFQIQFASFMAGRIAHKEVQYEHLWAVRKDGRQLDCELRDHGAWGMEVQVYREREFLYGRRFTTCALALKEADEQKAQYLREGGVLIA